MKTDFIQEAVDEESRAPEHEKEKMRDCKHIALVAHDSKKEELIEWALFNRNILVEHELYATGTTGQLLEERVELKITKLLSGPLGGDQQVGAMIADGIIELVIFFADPLSAHSHDVDIKALLRLATVWNIPIACNRATADFVISSPLLSEDYERILPNYEQYQNRLKKVKKSNG